MHVWHFLHAQCADAGRPVWLEEHADVVWLGRNFPSGWSAIAKNWDGLCSYTGSAGSSRALCNVPTNTHSWQKPGSAYKFMCGKIDDGAPFTSLLYRSGATSEGRSGGHLHIHTYIHAYVCMYIRMYVRAYIRICMHTPMHASTHKLMYILPTMQARRLSRQSSRQPSRRRIRRSTIH